MARKTIPQKVSPGQIDELLEIWKEATRARHRMAKAAYDAQDDDTKLVLDRIRDTLRMGAAGAIRLRLPGGQEKVVSIDQEYLDFNIMYVAVEILKDLAFMDIRVANFEFPEALCADCGKALKPKPKAKRKGR